MFTVTPTVHVSSVFLLFSYTPLVDPPEKYDLVFTVASFPPPDLHVVHTRYQVLTSYVMYNVKSSKKFS